MQLKPMLTRLQSALGCDDLLQHMLLLPKIGFRGELPTSTEPTHFVVGYHGSCHSQLALDITLWMAHQTRLATQKQVIVDVVHVVEQPDLQSLDQADQILWQARCLGDEWRGSFNAHLRIGAIAPELVAVATETKAAVMLLGCQSAQHPLVQQLYFRVSCPVLGVPSLLEPSLEMADTQAHTQAPARECLLPV
jgi:hypothetical protein